MSSAQLIVSEESEVSQMSCAVDNSGYVADHEQEDTLLMDSTYTLESDTKCVKRKGLKQNFVIGIVKHLINGLLADVLRFIIMVLTSSSKLRKYFVDNVSKMGQVYSNFSTLVAHGMDLVSGALKIYEKSVIGHIKYVRRVRRQSEVGSNRSLDDSLKLCSSDDGIDEHSDNEPHAKQRRVDSPIRSKSVVCQVYRWFSGPVTPENYHFSAEETLEQLLHKAEVESYHSSQDPDYEPNLEADDTLSTCSSTDTCETEEEMLEIESMDVEGTSIAEPEILCHETEMKFEG